MRLTFLITVLIFLSYLAEAQTMIYRQLPEFALSEKFSVEIKQGTQDYREVFTYQYGVNEDKIVTKTEHLSMFAFEPESGIVEIKIASRNGIQFSATNFELVNKTIPGILVRYENGNCLITLGSAKRQLLLRLKNDKSNPLQIFIDPYKQRELPANANVVTFEANQNPYVQTAQYDRYTVPNDVDAVYIEDGAMIKGTIHTASGRTKPLIVFGRGVLLGNGNVVSGTAGIPYNTLEINNGNNHIVEGITVIKSRHFGMRISDGARVDNVKMLGYNANNDGIVAGDNSEILNCFLKVDDDNIKLYNDNIHVKNCTFYTQNNGAVFQFAWNSIVPGSNCIVEDCEVVEVEYTGSGDPAEGTGGIAHTFISLRETDARSTSEGNVFRNILIQGQLIRFIGINGKYGSSRSVSLKNTILENIEIVNPTKKQSWIYTGDSPYEVSFNFDNVKIDGKCIEAKEFKTEGNVKVNFTNCQTTSMNENLKSGYRCYPNPANHSVRVEFPGFSPKRVQIFNSTGMLMYNNFLNSGEKINVQKFPNGIYLFAVNNEFSKCFIKN